MKRCDRKKQAWKAAAEIQNHPKSGNQRVQVRDRAGKCRIAFAGKVHSWKRKKGPKVVKAKATKQRRRSRDPQIPLPF